ncbi:hypothetical protein BOTBODRAFT_175928 [Botryobasidium botryosum FD-172 SS1]|uniref:Mediator of RNA polymerase II transcription subunit 4 n=1 Tax=Botryobasidium botryosum (strain FD-172 SS1) TaxID=930990 RepID=A0A067MMF5_BOTB1|nr:hypothetical protein BOTBODRAFT_175928 [Botryobasidium botryosum FD-172 SS1]
MSSPPSPPKSMRATLHAPLAEFTALTQTLFLSLAPSPTRPPAAPSSSAFLACDAALAAALREARAHQVRQRRIEALKLEVLALEGRIREVCVVLEKGRRELEGILEEGEERVRGIEQAKKGAAPYTALLSYASILSTFTSAPPSATPLAADQRAPANFRPPFPTEEMMRKGRLNEGEPLGTLAQTREIGRPPTPSVVPPAHNVNQGARPADPINYRQDYYHREPVTADVFDLDLNPDLDL